MLRIVLGDTAVLFKLLLGCLKHLADTIAGTSTAIGSSLGRSLNLAVRGLRKLSHPRENPQEDSTLLYTVKWSEVMDGDACRGTEDGHSEE